MTKNIKFTKEGFEKIKKEKEDLLIRRKETVERLTKAREMGDLSENSAYRACKMELSDIDRRLRQIDFLVKNAEIGEVGSLGVVGVGSKVKVNDGKENFEYMIVGDFEADPVAGKVSGNSPIGAALLGRKKGESVTVEIPIGRINYKIVEVR